MKNIRDTGEEVKIATLAAVWKNLIPTLMDDSEDFRTSGEEIARDVVQIARKLALEVEPEM